MKFDRSLWGFLIIGIAVRCVAINQPLVDAHLLRQCITAAATKSLIEDPGVHLSSNIPWLGDIEARYVIELPVFNYLVMAVHAVTGNLDLSGKVTSILLWAASFVFLQFIWRRFLNREQMFWANLLFLVAPLGVFYGQAFMPEMLIQLLAFAFVLLAIRYNEAPTLIRLMSCAAVGLAGLLVKLPEFAHLYLILAVLVFSREGAKALIQPRFLIAAVLTIGAVEGWGNYVDAVNVGPMSFGSTRDKLLVYIGTWNSRFEIKRWAMLGLYLAVFIVPGPAALVTAYGLWNFLRVRPEKILGLWLLSLIFFYLLWFGNTAANQSYYNLPALAPLCALFGIGMSKLLGSRYVLQRRRTAIIGAALCVILPAIPVWQYLFNPDRQILAAARWVRANTQPGDVILFRPNHRWDMIDYAQNPVLAYYSERRTFVWTGSTPEQYRRIALERSKYAIATLPQPPPDGLLGALNRFRGNRLPQPDPMDWLENSGFLMLAKEERFAIYRRD
jgi:hypothetical protein